MQRMQHVNDVVTMGFPSLSAFPVTCHISTRHGGVSPAPWSSLNFSVKRGDQRERVFENFARFCAAVGVDPGTPVRTDQIHGTGVAKVGWDEAGTRQRGVDGLITDATDLPLFLVFADCVPLVLYDGDQHVLGVCHAGWRGTVNGIGVATLWAMQAAYGTEPASVRACIGPSIGPDSYQVGDEVVALVEAKLSHPEQLLHYSDGPGSRPYFDLWRANAVQLEEAGIDPSNIEISGIDTAQHTADFFSHRAEQGRCGLFGLLAWLNPVGSEQETG